MPEQKSIILYLHGYTENKAVIPNDGDKIL